MNLPKASTVVIGSGFAGAVTSARLVDAGFNVTLLERGPWRDTPMVREMGIQRYSPFPVGWQFITHLLNRINTTALPSGGITLNRRGVYEIHVGEKLDVVCSNQVGGGSHVYGGLNMRPDREDYWDGHHPGLTSSSMETHYDYAFKAMGSTVPKIEDGYPNMFASRMAASGHFVTDQRSQDLAMGLALPGKGDTTVLSSSGLLGSAGGIKATVDTVFLRHALRKGLTVRDLCGVTSISREDSSDGTHYRVQYTDHVTNRRMDICASTLILAAGTLNTLKLLLHSRDAVGGLRGMTSLGDHFSGNGDYAAYWRHNDSGSDLSEGLPTRGRVLLAEPHRWTSPNPWPLIVEGGLPYSGQLPWLPFLGRIVKQGTLLAGMGDDKMIGRVSYQRKALQIEYEPQKVAILDDIRRACDLVAELSGRSVTHFPRALSMHPIGGARVASSPKLGVIDANGQVFGHPGMFIADGAAMPSALGVAPSMSIAAWASHVAQGIVSRQG